MAELTATQQKELVNIMSIRTAVSAIGVLGAVYLAHKEKKGAWGYVGYIVLGGLVAGAAGYLLTLPQQRKVLLG